MTETKQLFYKQSTGELTTKSGVILATGYSGYGDFKNDPSKQNVKGLGCIPIGEYTFGTPIDSPQIGPLSIPLIPNHHNIMFGRSAFFMHGDSIAKPGTASHGCVIMPRQIRETIINTKYTTLIVQ